jgi:hypothetical protein
MAASDPAREALAAVERAIGYAPPWISDPAQAALPALRAALEREDKLESDLCWISRGTEGFFERMAEAKAVLARAKRDSLSLDYEVAMRAALERWILKEHGKTDQLRAWAYAECETRDERAAIRALSAGQPHAATAPSPGTSDPQVG